jgi:ABC-type dipeptide/oligopeptide/nickel transport system permease component
MIALIIRRILQGIPVILGVITISFLLMNVAPGDPVRAMVGDYYDDATIETLREELGLNKSLGVQYVNFISTVCKGDLGKSFTTQRLVIEDLKQKVPFTLQLALAAMIIAVPVGILLGVFAAINRGKLIDKILIVISLAGVSVPVFLTALLLILIVGIQLQWLPPIGFGGIKFLILPAIALGTRSLAMLARTSRAYMLDVIKRTICARHLLKGYLNVLFYLSMDYEMF